MSWELIRPYEARNTIGEEVQLNCTQQVYIRGRIYTIHNHTYPNLGVIALGNEMECVQSYERREADGTEYVDCGTHCTQV